MSSHDTHSSHHKEKKHKKNRRPGRETVEPTEASHEEEHSHASSADQHQGSDSHRSDSQSTEDSDRKKIHIEFYGSELLKQKAPQAFNVAESVAEEWVNDGRFDDIPIESPLAKAFATYGLRKAKKIEKKLERTGVIALVKTGIDFAQSKWRR